MTTCRRCTRTPSWPVKGPGASPSQRFSLLLRDHAADGVRDRGAGGVEQGFAFGLGQLQFPRGSGHNRLKPSLRVIRQPLAWGDGKHGYGEAENREVMAGHLVEARGFQYALHDPFIA